MSPSELLSSYDHLATCDDCRLTLSQTAKPREAFANLLAELETEDGTATEHLSYDRVAAYVDEELDAAMMAIARNHLRTCSDCEARADELRAFKSVMTGPATATHDLKGHSTFLEKLSVLWSFSPLWTPLRLAAALVLVAACVWVATVSLRRQVADLRADGVRLHQSNEELKAQTSNVSDMQTRLAELQRKNEELQRDNTAARNAIGGLESRPETLQPVPRRDSLSYAAASLALNDGGGQVVVDQHGNVSGVDSLSPADARAVRSAVTTGKVETASDLPELIGSAGAITRGSGTGVSFALLGPVGTVVQSNRPVFRWRELKGATAYIVNVYDSGFNQVATSDQIPRTEWTTSKALEGGRVYLWQVTAIRNDEHIKSPATPAPEAKFRILDVAAEAALQQATANYANSHLMRGILYLKAGILPEAEREFQALVMANPKSPIAMRLLRNVRKLRAG